MVTSMGAGLESTKTNRKTDWGSLHLVMTILVIFLFSLLLVFLSFPIFCGFGCVYFNASRFLSLQLVPFVLRKHWSHSLLCVFKYRYHNGSNCLRLQNFKLFCCIEIIWFWTTNEHLWKSFILLTPIWPCLFTQGGAMHNVVVAVVPKATEWW